MYFPRWPCISGDSLNLGAAATYLCSLVNSHQPLSQPGRDSTDSLVQPAAASAVDSVVDDLVKNTLSFHDMATSCAVDAVVE